MSIAADKIDALIGELTRLRAIAAADDAMAKKLIDRAPDYRLKIEADGKPFEYRFYAEGDDRFAIRDNLELPFKIGKSEYERLSGTKGEQIVLRSGTAGTSTSEEPAS